MIERWNDAIDLVERTLPGEIDVADLARAAHTSEYHFRRVFAALAGMGPAEYVRRRRLTLAAAEVLDGRTVLDVAIRHGYGSADAFTRAFTAMHGLTPTDARRPGAVLRSQARLRFRLTIEGSSVMHHRITDLAAFRLVGRSARIPVVYRGENTAITAFHASLPEGLDARLEALADVPALSGLVAATTDLGHGNVEGAEIRYHYAVATTRADLPADLDVELDTDEVPAGTWAVFEGGSDDGRLREALQDLYADSAAEWFPSNPYRMVPGPSILRLVESDAAMAHGRGELWIPVEREERAC